jgi:WD40 repeat protein
LAIPDVIVSPGSTTYVEISVKRQGCDEAIALQFEGLPEGISCQSGTLAPGLSDIRLALRVPRDAKEVESTVRIVAVAGKARAEGSFRVVVRHRAPNAEEQVFSLDVPVQCAAWAPDGHTLLIAGGGTVGAAGRFTEVGKAKMDYSMRLWDVESGKEIRRFEGHTNQVRCVAFSADGQRIVSGSSDSSVRVWEVGTAKEICRVLVHAGGISTVRFSAGNNEIMAQAGYTLHSWDVETRQEVKGTRGGLARGFVQCGAISPDGRWFATGTSHFGTPPVPCLHLWDLETGKDLNRFPEFKLTVSSIAFSPDSRRLLTGGSTAGIFKDGKYDPEPDYNVRLWEVKTGKQLRVLEGHTASVHAVAFSPDGRRGLSGAWDNTARLWDLETGKEIRAFVGHTLGINRLAFSPDGRRAATVANDRTVRIWNIPPAEAR